MESMWISEKRGLKESSVLIFHSRKSTQKQKSSSSNITVSLGSMENHWKSWKWFPQENEKQRGNHSVGMKTVTFHNKLLGTILTLQSMWKINTERISSVQSLSRVWIFATPWTAAWQAFPSITNSWSLFKLMSIELVMPSNHLILCCPLLLLLPSIFPNIRGFSNESVLHIRWPKYWSFSFSISPSNEYSRLISFRMDWLNLPAVQGTLKSLLQHHSSKASILWCSAFFIVQLSHPCITTGKIIALTIQTFVGKVMSLLFNMLSRLVIAFLPWSKHLLISWQQSPSAVILEPPQKIKSNWKDSQIY